LASADCGDGECIQYALDTACAPTCGASGACATDSHCDTFSTVAGDQVQTCVPDVPACGQPVPDGGAPDAATSSDAGVATDASSGTDAGLGDDAALPTTCGGLAGPTVAACCTCGPGHTCTANNCYGGWWCNTASCHCQAPPTSCGGSDAGSVHDAGSTHDAGSSNDAGHTGTDGGVPTGPVGPMGGTVPSLFFAVLGDTRPAVDTSTTSGYPTAVITRLYQDLEALSPRPQFVVTTGDYCFAIPTSNAADSQMQLYMGARANYSGTAFFAMGNHECNGQTSSNCGPGSTDGVTNNYQSFLSNMLSTIHQTSPYYMVRVDATDGSWTSKFIFAAPNAWDANQMTFLTNALATPTTYTFVIDHEPAATSSGPPGLSPLNTLVRGASPPVTLRITGHTHTYAHPSVNEVVIGLGGAPLASTYDYGYLTVTQTAAGDIEVAEFDYMTGAQNDVWRVHPDGTAAP
jgi:hypothetical protein